MLSVTGNNPNVYDQIIEDVFLTLHQQGTTEVRFGKEDIERAARKLGIKVPSDLVYHFQSSDAMLPTSVVRTMPGGSMWIIRSMDKGHYCFALVPAQAITPSPTMIE